MDERSDERRRPESGTPTVIAMRPRFVLEVVGWVLLALLALTIIDRSRHVLGLVLVAIVLAMVLRAPIDALGRRLPRWAALTIVVIGSLASIAGLLALGSVQLDQEIEVVGEAVTERIESVDPESTLGRFLTEGSIAERIERELDDLPAQIIIGSPDAADGARLGLEALLVVVLVIYALLNGPRLARAVLGGDHPQWWAGAVRAGVRTAADEVRRLVLTAVASGLVALAVAAAFDLQGAPVLALWAGIWSVVPIFGPVVGYAPMLVVASLDGWTHAATLLVVAVAVAAASWYVDRHATAWRGGEVRTRTGPFGITVALVTGLQFGWFTGPLVAVFVVAAAVAILAALGDGRPEPGVEATQATGAAPTTRRTVWRHLDPRSAVIGTAVAVLIVVAIAFVVEIAPVPAWILIGAVLAIALSPVVGWLDDHSPLGRGAAVGSVVLGLLAAVAVLLVFAVPSIVESVRDLDDELPRIAADLEQLPLIGDELAERGIADRLQTTLENAPEQLASDTSPLEHALRSIGDGVVATFWILLLTVTALIDGARAGEGLRRLVPADRRGRFDRVREVVVVVIARYAVGSIAIAAIAGTAVFVIALVGGVPLAPLLGLWAALSNFIPQLGGFLGGAPLVVLALTTGATKGVVILGVYLVYMQIENRVIQPLITSRAVDIPPLIAMVAVLVGGAAGGVVGAVLATPLVGVVKSLSGELRRALAPAEPDPVPVAAPVAARTAAVEAAPLP